MDNIEAIKQFYVKSIDKDKYFESFKALKEYRDVFLDHLKTFSTDDHFGSTMADEFDLFRLLRESYDDSAECPLPGKPDVS